MWAARRRFGPLGGRALAISAARTLAASAPLAALVRAALAIVAPAGGFARKRRWLAVTIAGGAVVFVGASALLGSPERATLLGVLPSRRRR